MDAIYSRSNLYSFEWVNIGIINFTENRFAIINLSMTSLLKGIDPCFSYSLRIEVMLLLKLYSFIYLWDSCRFYLLNKDLEPKNYLNS